MEPMNHAQALEGLPPNRARTSNTRSFASFGRDYYKFAFCKVRAAPWLRELDSSAGIPRNQSITGTVFAF